MQFDKQKLSLLLMLPDKELLRVLEGLARDAGIPPESLGLDAEKIRTLRAALTNANDRDLEEIIRQFNEKKNGGK